MARDVFYILCVFFCVAVLTLHARTEVLATAGAPAAADGSAGAAQVAETWTFAGMTVTVATDGTWLAWAIAQLQLAAITRPKDVLASWIVHFLHHPKRSDFKGHLADEFGKKAVGVLISYVSHKVASSVLERLAVSADYAWFMGPFVAFGVLLMYTDWHRSCGVPQGGGTPTVNIAGAAARAVPKTRAALTTIATFLRHYFGLTEDESQAQSAEFAGKCEGLRRSTEARYPEDNMV